MFWEKKEKDKGLPDLPRPHAMQPPVLRDRSFEKDDFEEDDEIHELPSFPDSPMQRGFSQSAIKDAVANEDIEDAQEMSDWKPEVKERKQLAIEEWSARPSFPRAPPITPMPERRDSKPIFVRVDKFQLARASLENVKVKLGEIEELLKTIREVKAKEDAELSSWESEMENIKSRVQNVITDIFERVDN